MQDIDHIDGNPANNAFTNLRDVSKSVNLHNQKSRGYYWHAQTSKWHAEITVKKVKKSLGLFKTEDEARAAYAAAKKLYGFIHR